MSPLKPPKKKVDPWPVKSYRAPPDIEAHLDGLKPQGYEASAIVVELMRIGLGVEEEIGADMARVKALVGAEYPEADDDERQTLVGKMVARLAKEALAARKKK